jgi:hypothetical protein
VQRRKVKKVGYWNDGISTYGILEWRNIGMMGQNHSVMVKYWNTERMAKIFTSFHHSIVSGLFYGGF